MVVVELVQTFLPVIVVDASNCREKGNVCCYVGWGLNAPAGGGSRLETQVDISLEQTRHLPTIRKTFTSSVPGNALSSTARALSIRCNASWYKGMKEEDDEGGYTSGVGIVTNPRVQFHLVSLALPLLETARRQLKIISFVDTIDASHFNPSIELKQLFLATG